MLLSCDDGLGRIRAADQRKLADTTGHERSTNPQVITRYTASPQPRNSPNYPSHGGSQGFKSPHLHRGKPAGQGAWSRTVPAPCSRLGPVVFRRCSVWETNSSSSRSRSAASDSGTGGRNGPARTPSRCARPGPRPPWARHQQRSTAQQRCAEGRGYGARPARPPPWPGARCERGTRSHAAVPRSAPGTPDRLASPVPEGTEEPRLRPRPGAAPAPRPRGSASDRRVP